jgi:hypothetical protein
MSCSQRKIWFASRCVISFLVLGGCSPWTPTQPGDHAPHRVAAPSEPACTNWNAYSEEWHRRHCDVAIRWCDTGHGGSTGAAGSSGAAGTKGTSGAGGTTGGTTGSTGTGAAAGTSGTAGSNGSAGSTNGTGGGTGSAGSGGASVDSGVVMDGGHAAPDAGHATDGKGTTSCLVSATCPQGTSCVTGSCQACAGGVCACQRDDDCSSSQVCNHDKGACTTPPPACTVLTAEAACSARVDCAPIYGGMSCTNAVGSPCHSGEANCTCEMYSFAACVGRD